MIDPYDLALIVLGTLVVLLAAALLWRWVRTGKPSLPPYALRAELLDGDDRALFALLQEAFGDDYALFAKVPLDHLLQPTAASTRKRRRAAQELEGRSVPFLLCRKEDLAPVAAIVPDRGKEPPLPELDACALAVLRVAASPAPSQRALRTELERLLGGAEPKAPNRADEEEREEDEWRIGALPSQGEEERGWLDGIAPAPPQPPRKEEPKASQGGQRGQAQAEILCPECGTPMTRRRMVRGPHAGRELWVCVNFPACRKTLPVLPD